MPGVVIDATTEAIVSIDSATRDGVESVRAGRSLSPVPLDLHFQEVGVNVSKVGVSLLLAIYTTIVHFDPKGRAQCVEALTVEQSPAGQSLQPFPNSIQL